MLLGAAFVLVVLLACFSLVLFFGAPYLPTKTKQIEQALDLLDLQKGQSLLELGAGTGGMCLAAAKRGIRVTAYELNPVLVLVIWARSRRYKKLVTVKAGNFWKTSFSGYEGVYVFLLDSFMPRLHEKMLKEAGKGTKLASYTFKIPGIKVDAENGPIYLYKY